MSDALDEHVAQIDPANLDAAAEITSEHAYDQALDEEIEWRSEAVGALARGPRAAWTNESGSRRRAVTDQLSR